MKISICIPTYEAYGNGVALVSNTINSVLNQTYKNFEIIISDHSINDEIKNYIIDLNNNKIIYLKNKNYIGLPSHNSNNAIKNSSGDLIKVLNMDDFFDNEKSLEIYVNNLITNENKWLVSSSKLVNLKTKNIQGQYYPHLSGDGFHLLNGVNTIGCPSVAIFPKEFLFDTEIKYMIDCELWYRLYKDLGAPFFNKETPMCIGVGDHQLTSSLRSSYKEMLDFDVKYCYRKYKI